MNFTVSGRPITGLGSIDAAYIGHHLGVRTTSSGARGRAASLPHFTRSNSMKKEVQIGTLVDGVPSRSIK
jgi:hypothetical protein